MIESLCWASCKVPPATSCTEHRHGQLRAVAAPRLAEWLPGESAWPPRLLVAQQFVYTDISRARIPALEHALADIVDPADGVKTKTGCQACDGGRS